MTFRSQRTHAILGADAVRLTFRNRADATYTVTLPWLVRADLACLAPPAAAPGGGRVAAKNEGSSDYQLEFEQLYKPYAATGRTRTEPKEPILHFDIVSNEFGRFGLIRLDSFSPEKLSDEELIAEVARLQAHDLKGTEGVVIDLRDNGGGSIALGEGLAQLFTPATVEPEGFKLRNSALNHFFFETLPAYWPDFLAALRRAGDAPFAEPVEMTRRLFANAAGQAYFKPVAIFANSSCYSACDMFSATMQDHRAAVVFSEDGQTGGGGANVVAQSYFLKQLDGHESLFKPLPGGQDMRVSWRQTVRSGVNAGLLLEGRGVVADKTLPLTTADFYTNDGPQMHAITRYLSRETGHLKGSVAWRRDAPGGRLDVRAGEPLVFPAHVAATDTVTFGPIAGAPVGRLRVDAPDEGADVDLVVPLLSADGDLGAFEFVGLRGTKRVWRTTSRYRRVPPNTVLGAGAGIALDFAVDGPTPLKTYTAGADAAQGWTVQAGSLKAGLGEAYADGMTAEASLFLDLTGRAGPLTLSFTAAVQSEEGYDFFSAAVVAGAESLQLLAPLSGKVEAKRYTYDLSAYAGRVAELRFTFQSDGSVNDRGVTLDDLVLE